MVKPERRTRTDIVAAATIALVVAVAAALIWWTSDARATISHPADGPAPEQTPARDLPAGLRQLWSAASPATEAPVVVDGTVVTGAGREMTGRHPVTGQPRWSYARDRDLCAVSWMYHVGVAVYPDSRGCGQVSTIDASSGHRGPARSSYADKHVRLSSDGNTVLSVGATRLELWRFDMVRSLSYGEIDAPVKPGAQRVGTGCRLLSAAGNSSAVSVLEACPGQADVRLTLLQPRSGKDDDEPETRHVPEPGISAESGARVLAVSGTNTAVYLPSPQPRVEVVDESGATVATTLLSERPSASNAVTRAGDVITWWTGQTVLAFDATKLTYRFTVATDGPVVPLGPAAAMAGWLLVPVSGGLRAYAAATGEFHRHYPVDRPPGSSAVVPAVSGSTVLEQRGDTVVALG